MIYIQSRIKHCCYKETFIFRTLILKQFNLVATAIILATDRIADDFIQ